MNEDVRTVILRKEKADQQRRKDFEFFKSAFLTPAVVYMAINYVLEITLAFLLPFMTMIQPAFGSNRSRRRSVISHLMSTVFSYIWLWRSTSDYEGHIANRDIAGYRFGVITFLTTVMLLYSRISDTHYSTVISIPVTTENVDPPAPSDSTV